MTWRRLFPLIALAALLIGPFGRMAAAEAAAHHAPAAAVQGGGHCKRPADTAPERTPAAIDCLIACATVAPPEAPAWAAVAPLRAEPVAPRSPWFEGLSFGSDPPPPRTS